MFKKLSILAVLSLALVATGKIAQAQYSTVQYQIGGYGTGVRVTNYGNNGAYYGYQNSYGNPYYGNNYQNSYSSNYNGYGGYNGGNYNSSVGYYGYPSVNYAYVAPRLYRGPMPGFALRRGRW